LKHAAAGGGTPVQRAMAILEACGDLPPTFEDP
jgi:hypothetical protein